MNLYWEANQDTYSFCVGFYIFFTQWTEVYYVAVYNSLSNTEI